MVTNGGDIIRELNSAQEKILDKALYLISTKGDFNVPIRDICKEADVNVNAINYYFGSKEKLLEVLEEFFIENYKLAYSALFEEIPSDKKLTKVANEIMEYTLQYPNIQRIMQLKLNSEEDNQMKSFLENEALLYQKEIAKLYKAVFEIDDSRLSFVTSIFDSSILYPATYGFGYDFDTKLLEKKEYRLEYISFIITTIKKGV